ncbi:HAD hydrolase-like protein [Galbitalea soli]|uniref:HAD hydrolase-like protein n=1 Tax=Galbitalea soli TaxID=1268042 RepID=A0A7C9TRS7_9MICO|nr:HAD hydrolase-like protein [Galbitalea soli]NEM92437.1 HAD hydrolase-like protein [Galbitalea soli]NYJ29472.1 phosphoglycolate phosphatase [Galbitalea soli]
MTDHYTAVLFDLDGTIVDSAPGITATLAWTFAQMGRPVPTQQELLAYVGPPILDSFRDLAGLSLGEAAEALAIYRPKYLEEGVFNATLYAGVPEVLQAIRTAGLPLSLATSKPETPATVVLQHFGILELFDVITGASDDEVRSAKADVVAEALVRLKGIGADLATPIMVGDREHDVHGAATNGVPTIFVEWGYGAPAETLGAVDVASTPAELERLLLG